MTVMDSPPIDYALCARCGHDIDEHHFPVGCIALENRCNCRGFRPGGVAGGGPVMRLNLLSERPELHRYEALGEAVIHEPGPWRFCLIVRRAGTFSVAMARKVGPYRFLEHLPVAAADEPARVPLGRSEALPCTGIGSSSLAGSSAVAESSLCPACGSTVGALCGEHIAWASSSPSTPPASPTEFARFSEVEIHLEPSHPSAPEVHAGGVPAEEER